MDGRQDRQETVDPTKSRLSTDSLLPQNSFRALQRASFQELGSARFVGEREVTPGNDARDEAKQFKRQIECSTFN